MLSHLTWRDYHLHLTLNGASNNICLNCLILLQQIAKDIRIKYISLMAAAYVSFYIYFIRSSFILNHLNSESTIAQLTFSKTKPDELVWKEWEEGFRAYYDRLVPSGEQFLEWCGKQTRAITNDSDWILWQFLPMTMRHQC